MPTYSINYIELASKLGVDADKLAALLLPYRTIWLPHNTECAVAAPAPAPTQPASALARQVGGEHYKDAAIQHVEFAQRNRLNWCEAAATKYICRHQKKNGAQDIHKAIHYLQILLQLEYPNEAESPQTARNKPAPLPATYGLVDETKK